MKKRIASLLVMALLLSLAASPASAETLYGGDGWEAVFKAEEYMYSNFKVNDMTDVISGMQPGDTAIINLKILNEHASSTDWYMTNEVLYSLEDRSANSATGGGAYTYILSYSGPGGDIELFNSDTVGGEGENQAGEGLHQAVDALEDYFFLDTLGHNESGTITLEVALDGETQGNDYQDTLADLQMNFAVALRDDEPTNSTPAPGATPHRTIVKTGDESHIGVWLGLAGVSGVLLLLLALYGWTWNRKKKKGAEKK